MKNDIKKGDLLVTFRGKKYIALGEAWVRVTRESWNFINTVDVVDAETGKKRMIRYDSVKEVRKTA